MQRVIAFVTLMLLQEYEQDSSAISAWMFWNNGMDGCKTPEHPLPLFTHEIGEGVNVFDFSQGRIPEELKVKMWEKYEQIGTAADPNVSTGTI